MIIACEHAAASHDVLPRFGGKQISCPALGDTFIVVLPLTALSDDNDARWEEGKSVESLVLHAAIWDGG